MSNLFDRAGMSSATAGTGTLTLGSALGAVAPNLCGFLSFAGAGVADQTIVSYLILDAGGAWETGWGVYTASGTTLTRNVTKSSNANAAISLSGNEQVFITARAEDLATVEALAAANIAINGGMEVSQENGATSIALASGSTKYVVDQWEAFFSSATLAFNAGQATAAPAGLINSLRLTASTAGTLGASATDAALLFSRLEGSRLARLGFGAAGAQAVTVGFWVLTSASGTMTVTLRNSATNRSYPVNVPVTAGGWQWCTVLIPGDTTGTWPTSTALGAYLIFCFGAGSGNQGTNATWNAANVVATAATTNFFPTTSFQVFIGGVVMLPGAHQLSSEQAVNLIRPFDAELALCQRYYEKSYDYASLPAAVTRGGEVRVVMAAGSTVTIPVYYKVTKRLTPVVTFYSPATGASGKARDYINSADTTPSVDATGGMQNLGATLTASVGTTTNMGVHFVADARM